MSERLHLSLMICNDGSLHFHLPDAVSTHAHHGLGMMEGDVSISLLQGPEFTSLFPICRLFLDRLRQEVMTFPASLQLLNRQISFLLEGVKHKD